MSLDLRSLAWLREHHATISSTVLDDFGVSRDTRRRLVASGVLERVVDGGYRFTGVGEDEMARCAALCTSRPHLVVAGPTAGRLWDLRRSPRDGLVHVIAPPRSNPCRERCVRTFRTSALCADEIVRRPDGIRVTSPPRTVVDMTRYVDDTALASMIEHVLAQRLCTSTTLQSTAERLSTPGRPWVRHFLDLLVARTPGAPAESEWELRVFDALSRRGVVGVVRQHEVRLPRYGTARFDLAIPALRWALEVDVHPEHRTLEGAARDKVRDDAADAVGWVVRRVAEIQLVDHFAATIEAAVASIERRREDLR
jgi:hypothetical protein